MQRKPERISSLEVDRGLYVLRYAGASTIGGDHPVIYVRPSPGSVDLIQIVPYPGEPIGKLSRPGSFSVVAVEEPATLQITAQASFANGSLQAEVRLEPLDQGAAPANVAAPAPAVPRSHLEPGQDLTVLAHVARRGDIESSEGEWVGGPEAPAPIEGLVIQCAPHLGTLQYQVMISGENRWSDWLHSGSFGGSRGRATALTGLRVRFAPANGSGTSLEGEALFLGSAMIRKDGLEMEFRSAAGLDPMVGIRLGVKKHSPAATLKPSIVASGAPSGRVRVFKASSSRRSG